MKTWEVKLDTGGNGLVTINVKADFFVRDSDGVTFRGEEKGETIDTAFYPMAALLGVKDVTP